MKRLTRAEQAARNRALVLDAARRVFLARGYHGATLEQIADEAGFSKGVVYSQFESKADLFLALLEARISERAAESARMAESLVSSGGLQAPTGGLPVPPYPRGPPRGCVAGLRSLVTHVQSSPLRSRRGAGPRMR
jgi:AcrR family transcriptional regulator